MAAPAGWILKATRVIIINYNAGDAVVRAVASVLSTREPLHLVVADNASSDGSCERLRSLYASNPRFALLENGQNLGFARAVNACARETRETYLLILNPDCELYPGALAELRQALEDDPAAALAAPQVIDHREKALNGTLRMFPAPGRALMTASGLWRLSRWIPLLRGVEISAENAPPQTCRAEAVSGACMLVRNEAFRQLGGFDEGFSLHFEDLDLMYRLRQHGHYCLFVPAARAFHQPGTSSRSRPWWVHRQKHLGMQRFFHKHYAAKYFGPVRAMVYGAIWLHYLLTLPLVWLRR
ncbi:MAG TPA: glycosyltransferase family 2 protein [Xanthomonadales bacterium]|nr:glycosyltransferase family 2 protein [Xanthomonadales bacterium]